MSQQLPAGRAIMFDPHPDDVDMWTGGTTLLLRQLGWDVHYVCCGKTNPTTRQQAVESAKVLDVTRHFLEIDLTGNSMVTTQLCEAVMPLLKELSADLVFVPSVTDYHQEHMALTRELLALFRARGRHGVKSFEIYGCDSHENREPIEIFIDISDVIDRHMESLRCHHVFDKPTLPENTLMYVKRGRSMMLGASVPHDKIRVRHAEGFRLIWGHPTEVSTLRLLFPTRFFFRPTSWLLTMH
jgi:LmbE family N-acetylglucosaminyl deacetylase